MSEVYVVEVRGEAYDGTCFVLVAETVEAAVKAIYAKFPTKRRARPSYRVEWGELTGLTIMDKKQEQWTLVGEFEELPGYCIEHTATFIIKPVTVAK